VARGIVLLETHPCFLQHDAGRGHPERPARLAAVLEGVGAAGLGEALVTVSPRAATRQELERVHSPVYLDAIEQFCRAGGGSIDADTSASPESWESAILGAGAVIDAAERLARGEGDGAFVAVRPPGHHATPQRAMGFCLLNNVAVGAAALAANGERVLIVDWDAHHGNGTQDAFYSDGRVAYVSLHQHPLYPGTGRVEETGEGAGAGATANVPLPPGTTGDAYLAAADEVIEPLADWFQPTWLIVSAGYDAHRADPLTNMGLSSGDFADLAARVLPLVPVGRRIAVLEGGYDLAALAASAGASVAALAGASFRPEAATSGGPGRANVDAVRRVRDSLALP
jgi:acetoin utilization deacetylase AcuC-like enzyme